jgi:hypothetical protein
VIARTNATVGAQLPSLPTWGSDLADVRRHERCTERKTRKMRKLKKPKRTSLAEARAEFMTLLESDLEQVTGGGGFKTIVYACW